MDWLTMSSADSCEDSGEGGSVADTWELGQRPLGEEVLADLVDELQADFLEDDESSCPDGDALPWTTVPVLPEESGGHGMLSSDEGLFFTQSPSASSMESGESSSSSGSSEQWMAVPRVSTLDIGSLSNPAEFFQRITPPGTAVDSAVDLVRSHHVGIQPLRPIATAKVANSLPKPSLSSSGADVPTLLAPRRAGSSRKKRPKRIPSGEASKCPYCAGAVIIAGEAAPELDPQSKKRRFARYRPRVSARKDNRLAAWYVKYGYAGPPYCKGCSESFNSHLLRQNAQAARGSCARENPCGPCKAILGHFSVDADQVYRKFDRRTPVPKANDPKVTVPKAKDQQLMSQVKGEVDDEDQLSVSLMGHKRPRRTSGLVKTVTAVAITFVAATTLMSMHSSSTDSTHLDANTAELGWTCGAGFAAHYTGTVEAEMEIHCAGKDDQTEFECVFDECHDKGLVPVERRTCRCDGCVRLGRCVGWQLEGLGLFTAVDALAESCPSTTSAAEAEGSDPRRIPAASGGEQFSWLVPGLMKCDTCSRMCDEHAGCLRFECRNDAEAMLRMAPPPGWPQPQTCTLYSAYAWPQPAVSIATVDSTVPEGVVWRSVNGDVWQWVLNPDYWRTDSSLLEQMETSSSGQEDLQYMWRFDSVEQQWQAVQSSLKQRPSPRSGATTWHDSTGSLFLFSGAGCGTFGTNPYGSNTYVPGAKPGPPLVQGCEGVANFADLWRYDTAGLTWQLLHADPTMLPDNVTRVMRRDSGWPRARERATVWAQEHRHEQRYVAWMFGGAGQTLGHTSGGGVGATTELWQYNYSYAESFDSASKDRRNPEQSNGAAVLVNNGHWVLVTIDQAEVQLRTTPQGASWKAVYECSRKQECPGPRLGAGGWNDPSSRAGGWIFGGVGWSTTRWAEDTALLDLWHFNGDAGKPVWRSIARPPLPTTHGTVVHDWPPAWVEPAGWTTSVGGGEIWVVGESGAQHRVYTDAQTHGTGGLEDATHAVVDQTSQFSNDMWVFFIAQGRWAQVSQPMNSHIQTLEEGGAVVPDPKIPWPGQRQRAVTGEGVIFGGSGSRECHPGTSVTPNPLSPIGLRGMWTWIDSAGNGRGSAGGNKS